MIEVQRQIRSIRGEWEQLATRVEDSPFLQPGWFLRWWEAFGSGDLAILTLRREGRLVGVLPVRWAGTAVLSPTNWDSDLYGAVAADDQARRDLIAGVFELSPRRIDFSFLDPDRLELKAIEAARRQYHIDQETIFESPVVDTDGGWDSYWEGRPRKLRSNVRRARRRLAERGNVEFELVADPRTDLENLLEQGFAIERSGWKGRQGTAIDSRPETRAFYVEAAKWAARRGLLRLGFLRLDRRPIAFHYGLETPEAQYLLKLGIDAEFERFGLGAVMCAEMIEHGFSRGLLRTEFLGAADSYKLRWANRTKPIVRLQGFAPSPSGLGTRLVRLQGRRLAKKLLRRSRGLSGATDRGNDGMQGANESVEPGRSP